MNEKSNDKKGNATGLVSRSASLRGFFGTRFLHNRVGRHKPRRTGFADDLWVDVRNWRGVGRDSGVVQIAPGRWEWIMRSAKSKLLAGATMCSATLVYAVVVFTSHVTGPVSAAYLGVVFVSSLLAKSWHG
jgi:hypothetical protein